MEEGKVGCVEEGSSARRARAAEDASTFTTVMTALKDREPDSAEKSIALRRERVRLCGKQSQKRGRRMYKEE